MCGILGLVNYGASNYSKCRIFRNLITDLLEASEVRGTDATGICVLTGKKAVMYKNNVRASQFVKSGEYEDTLRLTSDNCNLRAVFGHTRHKTKGDQRFNVNNHPIRANKVIGVHNGIISNDDTLFNKYVGKISRAGRVDSEIIFRLIDYHIDMGKSIVDAVKESAKSLSGSAACAFIHVDHPNYLTIFRNSDYGPVVLWAYDRISTMVFASTDAILRRAVKGHTGFDPDYRTGELHIKESGARIDVETGSVYEFDLEGEKISMARGSIYNRSRSAKSILPIPYSMGKANYCPGSEQCHGHCEYCYMGFNR